jgi:hypothetical protein
LVSFFEGILPGARVQVQFRRTVEESYMKLFFSAMAPFIAFSLLACVPLNKSDSKQKALNNAVDFGNSTNSIDIVIYYANETPDTAVMRGHYQKIDSILASLNAMEPNSVYDLIRSTYQNDISQFPSQVRRDVFGLKKVICEEKRFRNSGLFIFTNELARAGQFEYCLPDSSLERGNIAIKIPAGHVGDFRFVESPLAIPANLEAAFDAMTQTLAEREKPLWDQRYVWISKSHGSSDLLLTPKLLHRVDQMGDTGLRSHFKDVAARTSVGEIKPAALTVGATMLGDLRLGHGLVKDILVSGALKFSDLKFSDLKTGDLKLSDLKLGDLKVGDLKLGDLKSSDLKLGDLKIGDLKLGDLKVGDLKYGDLKFGDLKVGDLKFGDLKIGDLKSGDLSSDENPFVKDSLGISKTVFLDSLMKLNLPFPLIFLESCSSELSESLVSELRQTGKSSKYLSKIGKIYTSDRGGLKFETIKYSELRPVDSLVMSFGLSLQAALDAAAGK